ncbi:MAG: carbohydrate binding family 9 domain-containing protein [Chloroflexia bacterium]|nr:carbohydrate binding family 9 domain-containing protein [Chloroflexia bacterium]
MRLKDGIHIVLVFVLMVSNSVLYSQAPKSLYVAKRITEAPDIDGFIGEEVWDMAEVDSISIQYAPYNKKRATERTIFKILYDDKALYVAAILYDNPDSILAGLGRRDDAFDMNADQFIIDIGPYNDGINSFSFMVSSSGVQSDYKNYFDARDLSWDAVWISKTRILERGWVLEMKIPYSAIRFSKNIFQVWSLNVYRIVKRKEETSSWNFVDRDIVGTTNQAGELIGIENVRAPFRLSATPYLTAYLEKNAGEGKLNNYYKAGFDLKYGINQSFTLDASVLPDYGQVEYDDEILNVSPFETKYPEHRQFFSEEAEMFSKANVFYSRRIGLNPELFDEIKDSLRTNEIITENPSELDIISSVKLTGRNSQKFGLGVINTICRPSFAAISDTLLGFNREIETQSFTNYNVIAFDKTLDNNSFISLINTNLTKDNLDYVANVTGTEFRFSNRKDHIQYQEMLL